MTVSGIVESVEAMFVVVVVLVFCGLWIWVLLFIVAGGIVFFSLLQSGGDLEKRWGVVMMSGRVDVEVRGPCHDVNHIDN